MGLSLILCELWHGRLSLMRTEVRNSYNVMGVVGPVIAVDAEDKHRPRGELSIDSGAYTRARVLSLSRVPHRSISNCSSWPAFAPLASPSASAALPLAPWPAAPAAWSAVGTCACSAGFLPKTAAASAALPLPAPVLAPAPPKDGEEAPAAPAARPLKSALFSGDREISAGMAARTPAGDLESGDVERASSCSLLYMILVL